ncbi:hypothetical protein RHGRI_009115 [Rhododendron griersonianum]|uniref:Uncharacterized protein n=1 Tax=Rhododendron griersonianum TaxID=479676 RepID=A0AAV6L6A0_9ERIC|nr:hypothetical protein RHGRI_009115 [Rhododendron griersonianum]
MLRRVNANGDVASAGDPLPPQNLPMGGADWVELFVREMTNSSNMDDARARASRALEVLEKSICGRVTAEAAQTFRQVVTCMVSASAGTGAFGFQVMAEGSPELEVTVAEDGEENNMLKEQVEALIHENSVLKRAVSIQHERQKEFEDRGQELHHLKQMVSQYQEQLRTLEVNNYALTMHLKQAQQGNSIPGRFHPDVF